MVLTKRNLHGGKRVRHLCISAFLLLLALAHPAHAYLDPGTGNALVYLFISLIGALVYASKSVFYALLKGLGKKTNTPTAPGADAPKAQKTLLIFNEGKNYWNDFIPIVQALIQRKFHFQYYSMDVHDPGLTIDSPYMHSKYIGTGTWAYAKLNKAKADIMLSTTPNIGASGYPVKRSPAVKNLIHVFHSVNCIAFYHRESLDKYDTVLLCGAFQEASIRKVEAIRHLSAKKLVLAGLPYFDVLASKMPAHLPPTNGKTVLIAPSWGTKSCIFLHGIDFIKKLAEAGFDIILRPHPQSLLVEQKLIADMHKNLDSYSNIIWDYERDGTRSMERSDLLISDVSAIRMDYALLYQRPVITLDMPVNDPEQWELGDIGEAWIDTVVDRIGKKLDKSTIGNIVEETKTLLKNFRPEDLAAFRDQTVEHFRHSGEFIADYLIAELSADGQTQSQEA